MSVTCPQGHTSETSDFCDVCGDPIVPSATSAASVPSPAAASTSAPPPPAPPPPPPSAPLQPCPNCGEPNTADALFCEECGYDFTTGQLPPPAPVASPNSLALPTPAPAAVALARGTQWVAEVWVDPDWFTAQQAAGACPASGAPRVVALPDDSALIGRKSASRGVTPVVDCGGDGATSHRHAQLSLDQDRWSIEDLGSVNGTYVGRPDGTYPTDPIPANVPRALADDERVYLGAWTRVVVRRATPDEQSGAGA